jgi:two-component system NtrC family sensor kinase
MLLISLQARKLDVAIECKLPRNLPYVRGSSEQLKQVFLNLLMNACDFMPNGGSIVITGNINGGSVELQVTDTGPGLREEDIDRVFEPFFTTKRGGMGTGLGLSVCESIIKAHNGTITACNDPEAGAKFTLTLPIHRKDGTN